jgi:hypothetical protein
MFKSMKKFSSWLGTNARCATRSLRFHPQIELLGEGWLTAGSRTRQASRALPRLEPLEERQLLTASGSISAVVDGWQTHTEYVIDSAGVTWQYDAGNGWNALAGAGQISQVSAALAQNGAAELFAIGPGGNVWRHTQYGWGSGPLSDFQVNQVCGTVHNNVYVLDQYNAVRIWNGGSWDSLYGPVSQISTGVDSLGRDEVFGIGANDGVCYCNRGYGWNSLGLSPTGDPWTQISGTINNAVYAVDVNGAPYYNDTVSGYWQPLYGTVRQIDAGLDQYIAAMNSLPSPPSLVTMALLFVNN